MRPAESHLMSLAPSTAASLSAKLNLLYGDQHEAVLSRLLDVVARYPRRTGPCTERLWDERDVVLITYADQVRSESMAPLKAQLAFLEEAGFNQLLQVVHLLPFFPSSSDDGFSVIDFRKVDPRVGDWDDISEVGCHYDLMMDLVLNHASAKSAWFEAYQAGQDPYLDYFIELDPRTDVSRVTRPRSTPLLTRFPTSRGTRSVWTTFSADQVDLNYANPDVLIEMVDVLLGYLQRGARIIRLDAVAYVWKTLGTNCVHLPQTHLIVQLLRELVDALAPGALLITETNVPHAQNMSYLAPGDEAHMIYQFSLAPLLLYSFLSGNEQPLSSWLGGLTTPPPGTTYFNFTASHDGIGVRPLEGLLPSDAIWNLVDAVLARGGLVSTRQQSNGRNVPYELNISLYDALGDPEGMPKSLKVRRFLSSQALMLAVRGVPAVYFHSLVGTPNDYEGVNHTQQPRSINRRKYQLEDLRALLRSSTSPQAAVIAGYRRLLAARIGSPAFHPDAELQTVSGTPPGTLAFVRTSLDGRQRILVAANFTWRAQEIDLGREAARLKTDLLTGLPPRLDGDEVVLDPFETVWIPLPS